MLCLRLTLYMLLSALMAVVAVIDDTRISGLSNTAWNGVKAGHMYVVTTIFAHTPNGFQLKEDLLKDLPPDIAAAIRDQLRNAVHHRGFIWSDGIYAISKFLPGQDNGFDSNFDVNHLLNIHGNDIGLAYWRRIVANLRVLSTAKIYGLQQDLAHLLPEYDL